MRSVSDRQRRAMFARMQAHQTRVVRRIAEPGVPGLVVAHGLGSGKTRTAIEAHRALGGRADVVVPAALKGNYAKELKKWHGPTRLSRLVSQQIVRADGRRLLAPLLIVDEAHRARNPETHLAQAIGKSLAQKRLLLTGTPMYNDVSDIATLVNQAAGRRVLRAGKREFAERYLRPGFFARLTGRQLSNRGELGDALKRYVDYHGGDTTGMPTVETTSVPVAMGRRQSALYRAAMGRIPWRLRMLGDLERLKPFLTGPRQVSNTAAVFDPTSTEAPKLERALADLRDHLRKPEGKALVYSHWLKSGIEPLQRRLDADGIPYGSFTGKESLARRNETVRDFNAGKRRVLLVSSSGTEGLDLKGTRMVQVLEPHFNNMKIRQVIGRAVRLGSHDHLPPAERRVEVRRYVARPRVRFGWWTRSGVDQLLEESSRKKDLAIDQVTKLMGGAR